LSFIWIFDRRRLKASATQLKSSHTLALSDRLSVRASFFHVLPGFVFIFSMHGLAMSQTANSPATPATANKAAAPTTAPQAGKPGVGNSNSSNSKSGTAGTPGTTGTAGGPDAPKIKPNVAPAPSKKNTLALGPLQSGDWKPGCGCRFYKPTDQKENGPLLLRMSDKKQASIRAEGKLEALTLMDEQHILKKPPAIQAKDRMMLKFRGGDTTASFSGSAERNCPKFNDSCKAVSYQGVLTLSQAGKQGSFPVWGLCGC
jgi:hypothetical protein